MSTAAQPKYCRHRLANRGCKWRWDDRGLERGQPCLCEAPEHTYAECQWADHGGVRHRALGLIGRPVARVWLRTARRV